MISEKEKEEIRMQAKEILDNFAKALEKVKNKEKKIEKKLGGFRNEKLGDKGNLEFREQMFKNAPTHDGNCVIAEKKKW
jgi:Asp-tRNA(Asn)/Glu-tRNA(Gln) amidotransferase C subunit